MHPLPHPRYCTAQGCLCCFLYSCTYIVDTGAKIFFPLCFLIKHSPDSIVHLNIWASEKRGPYIRLAQKREEKHFEARNGRARRPSLVVLAKLRRVSLRTWRRLTTSSAVSRRNLTSSETDRVGPSSTPPPTYVSEAACPPLPGGGSMHYFEVVYIVSDLCIYESL
jgi:hypothetical protein